MLIRDYKYISTLNTGSTTYEMDLIKYFGISTDQTIDEVSNELKKKLNIEEPDNIKKYYWFKKKLWKVCTPFQDETFDQWARLETILAEDNNLQNINRLIALYFRPVKWYGKVKNFDMNTQEQIEEDLLDLDVNIGQKLLLFFSIVGFKYMNNIRAYYLNLTKMTQKELTNIK
jgi:hypothetical protein